LSGSIYSLAMKILLKLPWVCSLVFILGTGCKQPPTDNTAKLQQMAEAVQSAKYMDHYFYFAKRTDADEAARRLRGRNWIVEPVSRGADQKNWLVQARQPGPLKELDQVHAELDRLAKDLHGEYDGWEVPAAPEEQRK
jgi:hypothetical protein